jgi:hypothetical protein
MDSLVGTSAYEHLDYIYERFGLDEGGKRHGASFRSAGEVSNPHHDG